MLHHDILFTKGFYFNTYYLFMFDNAYDFWYSYICCLWPEKDPVCIWGTKVNVKLVAWTLHRFCTETQPSFVIRWWYPHTCCKWNEEDLCDSWIKDTRWKVMAILGYWTLHHFHTQTLQSLHQDLIILPSLRQWLLADLHWFWGQNMTGKGQI